MGKKHLAPLAVLLLSACTTGPDPEGETRARAWGQVLDRTDLIRLDNATLEATASTPLLRGSEGLEIALLTRIAGEAVALGAPRFAITFVNYDEVGLGAGGFAAPDARWIGTYADLLQARAELFGDGGIGFERVTAVVRLLGPNEALDRPAFEAGDLYETLLSQRIEQRNIAPRRRLDIPLPRITFER